MSKFWLLLLAISGVNCVLNDGVTEFYDVDGTAVHMIVSGSVLVTDEISNRSPRSKILQPLTVVKHVRHSLARKKHRSKKKPKTEYHYGVPPKNENKGNTKQTLKTYENPSIRTSVSGMVRDEIPAEIDRKTIYPPPSNMWKINKELTVTQQSLEEKAAQNEKPQTHEIPSIETQLERDDQEVLKAKEKVPSNSELARLKPIQTAPLQGKVLPYAGFGDDRVREEKYGESDLHVIAPYAKAIHGIASHLADHILAKFKANEEVDPDGKDKRPHMVNKFRSHDDEPSRQPVHKVEPRPFFQPPTRAVTKPDAEKPSVQTVFKFKPKVTVVNSYTAHVMSQDELQQEAHPAAAEALPAPPAPEPHNVPEVVPMAPVASEQPAAPVITPAVENVPNTATKEAPFVTQVQGGVPPAGVQTEQSLSQVSFASAPQETFTDIVDNKETQLSAPVQLNEEKSNARIPETSNVRFQGGQNTNTEAIKPVPVVTTTTASAVPPPKPAAESTAPVETYATTASVSVPNTESQSVPQQTTANVETTTQTFQTFHPANTEVNAIESPREQVETGQQQIVATEEVQPAVAEQVEQVAPVVQYTNAKTSSSLQSPKTEVATQQVGHAAEEPKENEQFVSARKNADDQITITAVTPQEAEYTEVSDNDTLSAKSYTAEKPSYQSAQAIAEKAPSAQNQIQYEDDPPPQPAQVNQPAAPSPPMVVEQTNEEALTQKDKAQAPVPARVETVQQAPPPPPAPVAVETPDKVETVAETVETVKPTSEERPSTATVPVQKLSLSEVQRHQQAIDYIREANKKAQEEVAKQKEALQKSANFMLQNIEPQDVNDQQENQPQATYRDDKGEVTNLGVAVNAEDIPQDNKVAYASAQAHEQMAMEPPPPPPATQALVSTPHYVMFSPRAASNKEVLSDRKADVSTAVDGNMEATATGSEVASSEGNSDNGISASFIENAHDKVDHPAVEKETEEQFLSRAELTKTSPVTNNNNINDQTVIELPEITTSNEGEAKPLNITTNQQKAVADNYPAKFLDPNFIDHNDEYFYPAGVNPGAQMSTEMFDLWKSHGIAPQRGVLRGRIIKKLKKAKANHVVAPIKPRVQHWGTMKQVPNNVMSVLNPKGPTGPSIAYQQTVPEQQTVYSTSKSKSTAKKPVDRQNNLVSDGYATATTNTGARTRHHEKQPSNGYGYGSGSGYGFGARSSAWGGGGGWAGHPPPSGVQVPNYPPPGMPSFPNQGPAPQQNSAPQVPATNPQSPAGAAQTPGASPPATVVSNQPSNPPQYVDSRKRPEKTLKNKYQKPMVYNNKAIKAKGQRVRPQFKPKSFLLKRESVYKNSVK